MSTIPNVSSIYRQLSSIYTNISISPNLIPQNSYSLAQKINNDRTCFEDMYAYKQKRHNQLMAKLQNSYEQHQQLVAPLWKNSNCQPQYQGNYQIWRTVHCNNRSCDNPAYRNDDPIRMKTRNFVMPKIRYRHIEDQLKKKQKNEVQSNIQQQPKEKFSDKAAVTNQKQQLQQQFYQDQKPKSNQQKITHNDQNGIGIGIQTADNKFIIDENRGTIMTGTTPPLKPLYRQNRNNNYQEKIEHYYELCRKNINKYEQQQPSKMKQDKYIRPSSSNKNKPMKLDEAIKLLSLD